MTDPKMMTILDPETGEVVGEFLMHKGRRMTVDGAEIPDPTPMQPPVGFKKLHRCSITFGSKWPRLAGLLRWRVLRPPEEADDFDVDDDPELKTQYEVYDLSPEQIHEELGVRSPLYKGDEAPKAREPRSRRLPHKQRKPSKRAPEPGEEDEQDD